MFPIAKNSIFSHRNDESRTLNISYRQYICIFVIENIVLAIGNAVLFINKRPGSPLTWCDMEFASLTYRAFIRVFELIS